MIGVVKKLLLLESKRVILSPIPTICNFKLTLPARKERIFRKICKSKRKESEILKEKSKSSNNTLFKQQFRTKRSNINGSIRRLKTNGYS